MAIHGGDSLGLDVILLGNDSKEYMATLDPPLTRNYPPLIILRTPFGDRYFLQHMNRPLAARYVVVDSTLAYAGEAEPGAMGNEPVWRIKRLDTDVTGNVTVLYANGTAAFDKSWDDRALYSY